MQDSGNFNFKKIGFIENQAKYRYELPRQSVFASSGAFLRWSEKIYSECAADLRGFDRVWLIWVFDQNINAKWHTKTKVPVPAEKDSYSVFATRSPYRPNPIGISSVELLEITPDGLLLGACDLLDGTAVLDVKPYIPEVDAFPDAKAGWRDRITEKANKILWTEQAALQADFILEKGNLNLRNFCDTQLSYRPADHRRKRVFKTENENIYVLHFRTWRIKFSYLEKDSEITICNVESNYTEDDLASEAEDKYCDKEVHRQFNAKWQSSEKNNI